MLVNFIRPLCVFLLLFTYDFVHGHELHRSKKSKKKSSSIPPGNGPISLGNRRTEGITLGHESTAYVTHLLWGGVSAINLHNGEMRDVVPGKKFYERGAVGIKYYDGALFVAGGGPYIGFPDAKMYVYDADTGGEIVSCDPITSSSISFMNGVTIKSHKAYITDTGGDALMVVDAKAALGGQCKVTSITLPESGGANGVDSYEDGLLIVMVVGSVWYLDLSDNSFTKVVPTGEVVNGDGMLVHSSKMYITEMFTHQISVFSLSGGKRYEPIVAVQEGTLSSPDYKTPASSIIYNGNIYTVSVRFEDLGVPAENEDDRDNFDEDFAIAVVRNVFDQ